MNWKRALRWGVGLFGAVLWLATPVLLLVRVDDQAQRQRLRVEGPTWAPIRPDAEPTVSEVGLRLDWSSPAPMVAPTWAEAGGAGGEAATDSSTSSGLIEEVLIAPGDTVDDGQPILTGGGIRRLAMIGRPIGRTLGPGDRGPDVAALNDMLARRGWPATAGDRYTAETSEGTRQLSETIGLERTNQFDPAWVVHLPEAGATVATVALIVGTPLPAAGETIATFAPLLTGATLIAPRAEGAATSAAGTGSGGEGEQAVPSEAAPPVDPGLRSAEAVPLPDGAQLRFAGADVAVGEDRSTVPPEALSALAREVEALAPYALAEGVIPATEGGWIVPAASVITGEAGTCLRVRGGGRERVISVFIEGGQESRTRVVPRDATLTDEDEVEVGAAAGRRECV